MVSETAVTVILTTSQKANSSIQQWKDIFKTRGITIKNLTSLPANLANLSRKDEIVNWFNMNKIDEDFVIIDDDKSLNELPAFLKGNLVLTSPFIGLTEEHVETVQSILHKDLQHK